MPENPYAHLVPGGPQENPYAHLLPEVGATPKKKIAPLVRLAQGGVGPVGRLLRGGKYLEKVGIHPAISGLMGLGGEELLGVEEGLEERYPRPEFERLQFGSPGEFAGSVGRNLPALAAEGIEMVPALLAAQAAVAGVAPGLAAKAPQGASLLAKAGQRAKYGAALGEAFALTSGEAMEDPAALILDPLAFAVIEPVAGLLGDVVRTGTRAARSATSGEGPLGRLLRGRQVERRRGLPESATTPEERAAVELRRRVDRGEVSRDPEELGAQFDAMIE